MANNLITSEQYCWNDITVVMGGRPLFGIRGINVEFGYEQEVLGGAGAKGHAINEKGFSVSGSIKVLQSDFNDLIKSYGKDYQRKYFDIIWHFQDVEDGVSKTHIVERLKFNKIKLEMNKDDAFMEIELPFNALDIKLGE